MNSKQRRKLKREFQHVIKMWPAPNDMYFMHDNKVMNAKEWCRIKSIDVRLVTLWDHAEFNFVKEKDAVYFALKWL